MTQATPLERALNCNKSVFIQACAGAGKTFALTKRYAAILDSFAKKIENGANPAVFDHKQILVITFTKKATAEMNRRIFEDVNTLLSGNEIKEFKGTGFCNVLRTSKNKNVLEFTERLKDTFSQNSISTIDSFCANILREFSYKLGLDPQFLSQDEHDTKRLMNETLDAWVSQKLSVYPDYFKGLLEDLSFYQIKEIFKSMIGSREILDEYLEGFEKRPDEEIWRDWLTRYTPAGEIENLVSTFEAMWKQARERCKDKDDALYKGLAGMYNALQTLDPGDPQTYRAFLISDVIKNSVFVTKSGTYIKRWPGKKPAWNDQRELVEDWFRLLKDTVDEEELLMTPGPQDKKIIPLLRSLITGYRDFDEHFETVRMERDVLDFSDIIILTHRLLKQHADVRKILGKRYRHIMLDEFQDTNPLRWEIIKMILDAGEGIKLFIVGDRKQSIYRFNNADVTVMNAADKVVRSMQGESLDFNMNYRSSQALIDQAINPLMRRILKKPGEPKEPYEADFEDTYSPLTKTGLTGNTIEMIWCEHAGNDEEYVPAYHTAYQVKRLLEEDENSKIDEKQNKPLIGVLLRRGTKLGEYLQAFHQFDIPVAIIGGKDFYASQALRDIFHLISVLDNPLDDHALIGLLRSPFFALPDPLIHRLADRGKISVFEAMSSIPELQNNYRDLLLWRERSKTLPLDELIADIIDEDDRELAYVSELMPEQQLANIDKALNIIRGLQRSGSSLREVREFLHYQIKTKADEAQAEYPAKARVQILTVHKAKGLEFPVVVIPEMNSKGNSSKDKFRYGKHADRPEITLSLGDDEKPGMLTRLKEITKKEEEAEDKRVFYVAVTRAIHKVLLLGEGQKALANSWWTKYALGLLDPPDKKDLLVENWPADIDIVQRDKIMSSARLKIAETLPWRKKDIFEAPGKYLYRTPHDLMGMKDDLDPESSKSGLGTAPGSIFHYCMEQGWLDLEEHGEQIRKHILEQYPDLPKQTLMQKIGPWLENIKNHELSAVLSDPNVEKYSEHKVKAWLGNGRDIVQVNGSIDLLYRKGDQWVVLDYKTDASKRLLSYYKKQLQSYQWMLKQAYGIETAAQIFFVSLNEIVTVEWDDAYFHELPAEISAYPELPFSLPLPSKLRNAIGSGEHLILCASTQHQEQVYLSLARDGLLRPDIKISTLNNFVHDSSEEGISQDRLRLMIRHRNPGMKNGTADHLAKALRDEELLKGRIKDDVRIKYRDITKAPGYRSAAEPYHRATVSGRRIILLDVYLQTDLEKDLIKRLSLENEVLQLSLSPNERTDKYTLLEAFSPREEVLACARHIKENCKTDDQVVIAVASMEKYAPHLERQLPQYGLRARFIGPRSLYDLPCTGLLMDYLRLCAKSEVDWKERARVELHPLMPAEDHLFKYDSCLRREPLKDREDPQSSLRFCRKSHELLDHVTELSNLIKADDDIDTCKACEKFIQILEKTLNELKMINPQTDMGAIYREMAERVKKESIPRRDQWNGIPVVGLLDSLGVRCERLYVLGMVDGDIPRHENENPFFIRKKEYSLELNKYFMEEWVKWGKKVVFASSTRAEDGSEQNRSSFLQNVGLNVSKNTGGSRRDTLLRFDGKKISGFTSVLVERHHEILEGKRDKFSGNIGLKQQRYDIFVTQVDKLLACPMKFYFETIMKSRPMDQDERLFWAGKKGNVVHKAYEYFIKNNGYGMEIETALELMQKCLNKALEDENINRDDALQMDHFRHYTMDMTAGSEKNCLVRNLELIKKKYAEFERIESEKAFDGLVLDHPDLDINLSGRVDKIMIDEKGKRLIASDFKTGEVIPSQLSKYLLSQLYLYLKYCRAAYPQYQAGAMYETLKKPGKDTKLIEYELMDGTFSQGKNSLESEKFEKHLRDLFSQIAAGKYYITEKNYSDACKHCPYIDLCRRDSRSKIKEK